MRETHVRTSNLNEAISLLSMLQANWALLAETDPAGFLDQVRAEIVALRQGLDDAARFVRMVSLWQGAASIGERDIKEAKTLLTRLRNDGLTSF